MTRILKCGPKEKMRCGSSRASVPFQMPDKRKRMVNRDGFLLQQMEKLQLQLRKVQSENCKLETGILLHEVIHGQSRIADVASIEMIVNLNAVVEMHLGKIGKRMVDLAPPPVPPLMGVNMWAGPSVVLSDPMIGFTADVSLGQGRSTEMEKDWQPGSGYVLGPTGSDSDVAPAVVEAQVEDEIERVIDFSSYGCNEEIDGPPLLLDFH